MTSKNNKKQSSYTHLVSVIISIKIKFSKWQKLETLKSAAFERYLFQKKVTHRKCESLPDPNVVALPTKYYIILLYFSKKEILGM